jgi:hypothetical protein
MTSGGLSVGGNGRVPQWNAEWDAANGPMNNQRCSAKVSMGVLQGNSLRVGHKHRFQKTSWLEVSRGFLRKEDTLRYLLFDISIHGGGHSSR